MSDASRTFVREAVEADLETVAAMLKMLGQHVGANPRVTAKDLAAYGPSGRRYFEILVAEVDGRILGITLYSIVFSAWRGCPGIFVSDLYVDDRARGRGLGTELLRAAIAKELSRGCAYLKLDVAKENETGLGYYRKRGFTLSDSDHVMILEEDRMRGL